MGLGPEFAEKPSSAPRRAPVVSPSESKTNPVASNVIDRSWTFPSRVSMESDETELKSPADVHNIQPSPRKVPNSPHRMSFFDVGGLLGESSSPRTSHRQSAAVPQPRPSRLPSPSPNPHITSVAVPASEARRGSHTLLQDIGGLLSPSPQATTSRPVPKSGTSGLIEALQSTPPNSSPRPSIPSPRQERGSPGLQDVGGLLN